MVCGLRSGTRERTPARAPVVDLEDMLDRLDAAARDTPRVTVGQFVDAVGARS